MVEPASRMVESASRVVEPVETTQPRTSYVRLTICPSGRTSTSRIEGMRLVDVRPDGQMVSLTYDVRG